MASNIAFVKRLEEVYTGEPWYGESITGKLKDVSVEAAFQSPKAGEHSIAEILCHMEFWCRSILYKITGDDSIAFSMGHADNWPTLESLKKKGWEKVQKSFEETQAALVDALYKSPELSQELTDNLNGTLEHDIYHLGQVGMVKKLINKS